MIKLKNVLNEAPEQWKVKDVIALQKAHEKVLRATANLQKAVANLGKVSKKNMKKPNGGVFVSEANDMYRNLERAIDGNGKFWTNWKEFQKAGKAAFPKDWN